MAGTFSRRVKRELATLPVEKECCVEAELGVLVDLAGRLTKDTVGKRQLEFWFDHPSGAKRAFMLLKRVGISGSLEVVRRGRQNKAKYVIRIPAEGLSLLTEAKVSLKRKCCQRAYLRIIFLCTGSVTDPKRGYHLELSLSDRAEADLVTDYLRELGIEGVGRIYRNRSPVVYLKRADSIADFLRLVGASAGLLEFEDVRVQKNVVGQVNRLVNCETANMDKTIKAALDQVSDIKLIESKIGLHKLPDSLLQVALARLEHPYISLSELGRYLDPPLTKSGVNYRLRKLSAIAEKLADEQKESG
ncbi:MAG: DNA-binding protein WhiA [Limnochordia bacterium]|jgi:DNA-binding protein WhiA|nr:DNA-binding protein WhiA [Limnochordia bacterium]